MRKTRITIVCDNYAWRGRSLIAEHGFSAYIEHDGEKILFDTGQGVGIVNNLNRLRLDTKGLTKIVLSHGHFDHTGGLISVLGLLEDVKIIAHPDVWGKKYVKEQDFCNYVGIPFRKSLLESFSNVKFEFLNEFKEIAKGVYFSGEIVKREKEFEVRDPRLKILKENVFVDDPFKDDISLLIETQKGPVVVLGCAHAGVVNILNHFKSFGYNKLYAIIGGSHIGFIKDESFAVKVLEVIDSFEPKVLAFGHCTGFKAMCMCAKRFEERFVWPYVGWTLEI